MPILALGINHNSAPVELREQIAFTPEMIDSAREQLKSECGVADLAILSTCNRMEIYALCDESKRNLLCQSVARYHSVEQQLLAPHWYHYHGEDAVNHIMAVASGLDSMVLGEPQILGQMKQVHADGEALNSELNRLFQATFAAAKQVRHETEIGRAPVSMAYAAVSLANHIFDGFADKTMLFVGAGETIELALRHFTRGGAKHLLMANRTLANAAVLAESFGGEAIELAAIEQRLAEADVIVTSTASRDHIISLSMVEQALAKRRHQPIFIVDLAVPRDVQPAVAELEDAYLYSVDDLANVINENLKNREQAAREARQIISQHSERFLRWLGSKETGQQLQQLHQKFDQITTLEIERSLQRLSAGDSAEEVLKELGHRLQKKYLHDPTVQLRAAGEAGQNERAGINRTAIRTQE